MDRIITVYFSRKGQNYWAGQVKELAKGNTERVAEYVQEAVGGDIFEVETVEDYPADYYACTDVAKRELNEDARPVVKALPDLDAYDVIYVGYPNWWGTMPMAMFTVLESFDLSGKRIAPFCTNEGSGMGSSERDLKCVCPGATVEPGLSIPGHRAEGSRAEVAAWAKRYV